MAKRKINRPKGTGGGFGGGQAGMVQQLQQLQQQIMETQNQLADELVTGTAGGGAIQITITGEQVCREVKIDPEMLKDGDVEMLQDMFVIAYNDALEKSRAMAQERLGPLSSGLGGLGLGL